jgi:probable DNA metabolism protein
MRVDLIGRGDFEEWRDAARELLRQQIPPHEVNWCVQAAPDLFDDILEPMGRADHVARVPPAFIALAENMICHSDPLRFAMAYRLLWRLQREPHLLEVVTDAEVRYARLLERNVGRDSHKMTAFVRFKEVPSQTERRAFVAWFEPDHFIVARMAPFFQRRFNDMDWLIATPKGSAAWDGKKLSFDNEPPVKPDLADDAEDLWLTYFANIFNPARLKVKMMQTEMPKKYWKNLPEAEIIPDLIAGAEQRVRDMAARAASDTAPKFHERLQRRQQKSSPVETGED